MSTAFVHKETTLQDRIYVPCIIDKVGAGNSSNSQVNALWDTGASRTCISERLALRLGLMADDVEKLYVADSREILANVYSVQITMGKFTMDFIRVCELPITTTSYDVIIGMDFMCKGDVSITNYHGKTTLTFREPSLKTIDYVEELNRYNKMHELWIKCGNNLCPCGSQKLWEKCHGGRH